VAQGQHQRVPERRQHLGALDRGRLWRNVRDRPLERRQGGVALPRDEQVAAGLRVQERGADRIFVAHELDRVAPELDGARPRAGEDRPLRGPRREAGTVEPEELGGVRHVVPQGEGALQVRERLRLPKDRLRFARRRGRRDERLPRASRRRPMRRELRRCGARLAALKLVGEPRVRLLALAGQQRRVDRLGEQRVAEAEAARRLVGDEHAVLDRLAQRSAQLGLGERRRGAQQRVAHIAPGGRRQPQHALRRGVEPRRARQQQVAQAARQLARVVARGGQQLLGEERVALGARDDRVGQRRRRRAFAPGEQRGQLVARERAELHHERRAGSPHAVGEAAHALGRCGVVGATGREQQHAPLVEVVREVDDEIERRRVGPVQVLEHEQHRRRRRGVGEQRERVFERARPRAGRRGLVASGAQRPQRLGERLEGQLGADEVEAAPDERPKAGRIGTRRQLRGQARLADARVAGDEHGRSAPRRRAVERPLEPAQLVRAPDEHLAPSVHGASIPRLKHPRPGR
jgi:hypothetical protein